MKKIDTNVHSQFWGPAPMDYFYAGELKLQADNGTVIFAQACFWPCGEALFSIDRTSMFDEAYLTSSEKSEEFGSLEEASASSYFPYYLELDQLTDARARDVMAQVDDTQYYQ